MNLLLDTSVLLWSANSDSRLSAKACALLGSADSTLWLSSVSVWELSIKHADGALRLPINPAKFITLMIEDLKLHSLDVTQLHALEVGRLPLHHRDPFDRMLIAQARAESLTLLTGDKMFQKYEVAQIFCGT